MLSRLEFIISGDLYLNMVNLGPSSMCLKYSILYSLNISVKFAILTSHRATGYLEQKIKWSHGCILFAKVRPQWRSLTCCIVQQVRQANEYAMGSFILHDFYWSAY